MRQPTVRAGVGASLAAVVLAAGCGGQSDHSANSSRPQRNVSSAPTSNTPRQSPAKHAAKAHRHAARRHAGVTKGGVYRAGSQVPASKRASVATRTARLVLSIFGLRASSLSASSDGTTVRADVAPGGACAIKSGTGQTATARLQKALPYVQSFQITVAGQPLGQYLQRNCGQSPLPGGKGRVVLTQTGSGTSTTHSFTVRSSRWTVEYVNSGTFFQVFPLKGSFPRPGAFALRQRGSGRHVLTGKGTFRLKIGAIGDWTVRVRDGA
jgi:hypothetical protein